MNTIRATAALQAGVGRLCRWLLLLPALLLGLTVPAHAAPSAAQAPAFQVIAFYNGTWDAAHISFVQEANRWFPATAAANNFSYTSTNDWERLSSITPDQYQVVLFLDDAPQTASQRAGFERYMRSGGAWMGFHVSAFTTEARQWPWFYDQFLGSGNFRSNTWGPTTAVLRTEDRTHPSTTGLPATFTSSVSEWYAWENDLRDRPDIKVLASVDPVSFPLGTDPNQSWYSGDYPVLWTNTGYRMLYANFGHNAMDYGSGTTLSSTFASETQNRFVVDGLKWLGGGGGDPAPGDPISQTSAFALVAEANGNCVDARAAATANGTVIQQYTCNGTAAQRYRFPATDSGHVRIAADGDGRQVVDVADVSVAEQAPLQLWTYGGGANQQWKPVREASGRYHFTARHSGKCLSAPASAAVGVQLVQRSCDGSAAQSFRLVTQS
ncbi:ThuA domain-containing protein [Streptomyces sp. NBC_00385]|uniref:ThuA domain-containing protein n=1 Tax=Streptomyces sp. NBC_00385 TaxID=2975733 RepID=UPI002DD96DBC|nr:ThuA domain-containing protein [Streptomyces sp. NBC_00385]WRZ02536.1 ThuA domain-containing protein [Streptomyces sp. NBC_00385]